MAKNILVITGSARKGGNTELMADAFIKGVEAAGHTVTKFNAGARNMRGCIGCETCWSNGRPCSRDDDFQQLSPLLEAADTLVLASPLYYFNLTAQIKAAIDNFFAYGSTKRQRDLKIKEAAMLLCGEATEKELYMYDAAIKTFDLITEYLQWENKGVCIAAGVFDKGDILKTDGLARAEAFGREM